MDWIDSNDMRTVLLRHYPGAARGDARGRERVRALEQLGRLTRLRRAAAARMKRASPG